jgi:hypothetical protein
MLPLLFDVCLVGGFFLLGRFAVRGSSWAFLVGIGVYTLDGLIFLVTHDWIGLALHAFVLVMIVKGLQAARQLETEPPRVSLSPV